MRFPAPLHTTNQNTEEHCSLCGSKDYEDLHGPDADQGYTGCCNEPICYGQYRACDNH